MKHLQASFRKYEEKWTAGVESGQGETPLAGAEVTIHKKDGSLKQVTLIKKVGEQGIGENGKHVTFWEFIEGWTSPSVEEDDNEPF